MGKFTPHRGTRPAPINTSLAEASYIPRTRTQHPLSNVTTHESQDSGTRPTTTNSRPSSDLQPDTDTSSEDTMSDLSVISLHYLEVHPELEGKKATVLQQIPHPRSFKRLTMDGRVEVEEAFTGALTIVSGLNADYFIMPYGVSCPSCLWMRLY